MAITVQIIGPEKNNGIIGFIKDNIIEVLAIQQDEINALNYASKKKPEIILLNYELGQGDSGFFINSLLKQTPKTRIILFGDGISNDGVLNCLLAGAKGYLSSQYFEKFLNKAIKAVYSGEAWVNRKMIGVLLDQLRVIN
jgi:DNA-binding NarL/FixJ family response regulator